MGWAKYYEDNISIYNNRMALRELAGVEVQNIQFELSNHNYQRPLVKTAKVKRADKNLRAGIMLSFSIYIERSIARRLQMNGWWFSKANNCWCNYNSQANRQYAQRLTLNKEARIIFGA